MPVFRLLRVILHLFRGLATCAFLFPLVGAPVRQRLIRNWSVRLLALCRVQLRVQGLPALASPALTVANHVSWLDIFVINALQPCRFVAKADIRDWPLIGWLCAKTGTIFISRGKLRDVRRIYQDLVTSLRTGEQVAFFPEGTTAAPGTLLPFHANLFEAAVEAQVPLQPCALRYLDSNGELHPAVDFSGETSFVDSMLRVLKASGMTAELTVLPAITVTADAHRRELADAARRSIAQTLGTRDAQIEPGF